MRAKLGRRSDALALAASAVRHTWWPVVDVACTDSLELTNLRAARLALATRPHDGSLREETAAHRRDAIADVRVARRVSQHNRRHRLHRSGPVAAIGPGRTSLAAARVERTAVPARR